MKDFFEGDSTRWEDFYHRDKVEANMYWSRTRAGLRLIDRLVPAQGRVLEIGSGPGHLSLALTERNYDVVSCDIALRMAELTRTRMGRDSVVVADSRSLPFRFASFDAIILIGVISYVSDPASVLEEIKALLKPGGVLVISSANTNLLFSALDRKIKTSLTSLKLRNPDAQARKSFFIEECSYYKAKEFNRLVEQCNFSFLASFNVGFGRAKLLDKHIFPPSLDIIMAKALSGLSRIPGFRWLGDYAFANVACFRVQ